MKTTISDSMAKPLKTFLTTLVHVQSNVQAAWKYQLLEQWPEIVGALHTKAEIQKVLDDTIVLGVYDSVWLQELYFLSDQLLSTINATLDQPRIKQIRFKKIVRGATHTERKKKERKPKQIKPLALTIAQEQALEAVKNKELRAVLHDFLVRCYRESS